MRKLTEKEEKEREAFKKKQEDILSDIPKEFHSYFITKACNEGNAYGYNEVLTCLINSLEDFLPALKNYRERIIQQWLCSKEEK